ncbi:nicotinamide riboside transporter PnuC [Shewanella yunxiaonensis]|uniref:Nicotinamide riboside transporter PnuC n=1 Tax=Shewanella yunxiaonensis TaxID=2829809 RepID=A0ABX7YWJ5_9GAMM|nr:MULTISPECIES: nicotinamide riboside transporter PnuC [Shewanella]MDF0533526.1 nicotinamide riboside transporter PnuC [Shewanella sp. A32]QUN07138.1 nicotinamide riboside transporter PnuC [Shewanella yunxiaonensis]
MTEVWQIINQAVAEAEGMNLWEGLAVLLALAYLLLAMKANAWCWGAALASTAIYTVLFWKVSLLMESILNVYYMVMALYGYWMWRRGGDEQQELAVCTWSWPRHLLLIVCTALLSLPVGWFMANHTHASFPYLDSATTCFAVMATWLVAQKVLENWLYWVVIDSVSIYLYVSKGLMLTSLLFVLYVVLAVAGYFMWRANWREQRPLLENH